jgi:N-alpha-acetyltransferase 40
MSSSAGQKRKAKSKSKSKAKKEARRLEKIREAERRDTIRQANWVDGDDTTPRNVLDTTGFLQGSPFRNYTKNNLSVHIGYASSSDLSDADLAVLYELTQTNMLEHYNHAAEVDPTDWSWNEKKKMEELRHPEARYLIARAAPSSLVSGTSKGDIVGFAHIRFELEGIYEVTYIYELQIAQMAQKHGLGKRIMQLIELVSVKLAMKWVMLTVFKGNDAAGNFYTKLKYELDEIDPSLCEENATDEPKPYSILSKCVDREEKKRLAAIKFLNNAVAEDERQEQAARAQKIMLATPTKGKSTQKKSSP